MAERTPRAGAWMAPSRWPTMGICTWAAPPRGATSTAPSISCAWPTARWPTPTPQSKNCTRGNLMVHSCATSPAGVQRQGGAMAGPSGGSVASGVGDIIECIEQRAVEIKDYGAKPHVYREQLQARLEFTWHIHRLPRTAL